MIQLVVMKKHLKYASYVLRHKFYVGQECFKRGLYWRGLKHDWSKFLPSEWMPYATFFNTPEKTPAMKDAFTIAWMQHWHRSDHHWQWWVRISDNGEVAAREMSEPARLEMLCDWIGVQRALGKNDLPSWYAEREDGILLGPKTKRWLKNQLRGLK